MGSRLTQKKHSINHFRRKRKTMYNKPENKQKESEREAAREMEKKIHAYRLPFELILRDSFICYKTFRHIHLSFALKIDAANGVWPQHTFIIS